MPRIIICAECGKEKPYLARGLCATCYSRQQRRNAPLITCIECGQQRKHSTRGLCDTCASRHYYHEATGAADKVKERGKLWYEANRERKAQAGREWNAANREKKRMGWQRYHARKLALPATLTVAQWQAIKAAYKQKCAYCGKKSDRLTQDHVLPVSKGGAYEIGNIVPGCRSCNSKKHDKTPTKPVQTMLL